MPQERQSQYPFPTATDALSAPGDRADKAARNIVSRRIDGIPKRGYIMGDCDHAPVVQGVRDLCEGVYSLVDLIDAANYDGPPTREEWDRIIDQNAEMVAMMEDHRCPEAPAAEAQ